MAGDNRTQREKNESAETIKEWFQLRSQGYTLQMIADQYGCTPQNVGQRLRKYRESLPKEGYDEYVASATTRLEELRRALQPGIDAGDWKAIDTAIKLEDRIAKLHGIDKPVETKVEIVDRTPEHIAALLSRRAQAVSEGSTDQGSQPHALEDVIDAEVLETSSNFESELE